MRPIIVTSAVLAVLSTTSALAQVGWSIDGGLLHTDNARRTDTGRVQDTVASLDGALSLQRESRHLQASVVGTGSYQNYLDDTFDDELVGQAVADVQLVVLPGSFQWAIADTYGQIATNQFAAVTPENRQNVNTLSTGPDVVLQLGRQSTLKLSGRYGDTHYEESGDLDTRNWGGSASFMRRLSAAATLGIVASQNRYDYDAPASPMYDQQALYASWSASGPRQDLSIDVGANRVKVADDSYVDPLVHLNWRRRVTPSWTMQVDLGSEYQNTAQQFAGRTAGTGAGATDVGISSTPAASHHAGMTFSFKRSRTEVSIGGGYSRLNYVGASGLDEDSWYALTRLDRRLTPRVSGFLNYRVDRRDYDASVNPGKREWLAEAGLDWRVGRSTFLAAAYMHMESKSPSLLNRYEDNSISLKISYRRGN